MTTATSTVERPFSIPILGGSLRGWWWSPASGGKVLRVLLGSYERDQTQLFQQCITPGSVLLDVGASVGYYTLLGAKLVGPSGKVFAFEPCVRNAAFLRRHVEQNASHHVKIFPYALGNENTMVSFGAGTGTGTGRVTAQGDSLVPLRRLDDIAREEMMLPTHVKIDVEGYELDVLLGGEMTIRKNKPTLFISTHNSLNIGVHEACLKLLDRWGLICNPIGEGRIEDATELFCYWPK
ncbi:MAG: FkbM family methyltransferase [Planctomycetaceae bacterium]|nr:FkbM family methyltransferase [Planctomycetaceae bacterium]